MGAWCEIVARFEIHDLEDEPDKFLQFLQIARDGVASAHASTLSHDRDDACPIENVSHSIDGIHQTLRGGRTEHMPDSPQFISLPIKLKADEKITCKSMG